MAKKQKPKKKPAGKTASSGPSRQATKNLPSFFYNTKVNCWIILLFSFLLYANTLTHQYTQDDAIVIYDNMYTTQGLQGFPGLLKYDTFKGFLQSRRKGQTSVWWSLPTFYTADVCTRMAVI